MIDSQPQIIPSHDERGRIIQVFREGDDSALSTFTDVVFVAVNRVGIGVRVTCLHLVAEFEHALVLRTQMYN